MSGDAAVKTCSFYASIAIYSDANIERRLGEELGVLPSRSGRARDGFYSWIYSTQDALSDKRIEDHLDFLKEQLHGRTQQLVQLRHEGCQIRVWIYFGYGGFNGGINGAFVLSEDLIGWLSMFGADVYVDVWG